MKAIEAYESAYPGSMYEREDGGFIRRDDAESLALSLLALIKSGDRAAEDLRDERDELLRMNTQQAATITQMQRGLELLSKDAARYRWLKSLPRRHVAVACLDDSTALDDAIDAEIAKLEGRK